MKLSVAWVIRVPRAAYCRGNQEDFPLEPKAAEVAVELAAGQDTAEAAAGQLAERVAEQVAWQAAAEQVAGRQQPGGVALLARHGKPPLTNRFALRSARSSL